jgi:hypothetical protein
MSAAENDTGTINIYGVAILVYYVTGYTVDSVASNYGILIISEDDTGSTYGSDGIIFEEVVIVWLATNTH